MYKVSIIVPMYNVENYLKDCLNSILNQTIGFENLEVIIVDDNSTDKSFEIAKEFSDKYENVALLKTEKKPRPANAERCQIQTIILLSRQRGPSASHTRHWAFRAAVGPYAVLR